MVFCLPQSEIFGLMLVAEWLQANEDNNKSITKIEEDIEKVVPIPKTPKAEEETKPETEEIGNSGKF